MITWLIIIGAACLAWLIYSIVRIAMKSPHDFAKELNDRRKGRDIIIKDSK